jgi:hypothetical protein
MSTEDPKTYIGALIAVFVAFLLFLFLVPKPTHQVVNCHLAEISPDFTPELRQQCRLLRATKL